MLGTFSNYLDIVGRTLANEGIDLPAELADRGVDLRRYDDAEHRLDPAVTRIVWRVVGECSKDPVFGLSMVRNVDYLDFEDLGVALVATGTAEAALARLVRYHGLISDVLKMGLDVGQRVLELRIDHARAPWRAGEFTAALVLRVLRARFNPAIQPIDVHLGFDNPAGLAIYRRYFRCPVVEGAPITRMTFDRLIMARNTVREPIGVAARFEQLLSDRVQAVTGAESATETARAALTQMLGSQAPTLDRLAAQMNISDRTLQRKLRAEGTSFVALLDDTRRRAAAVWLHEGRLSRAEIAYLLGFSQPSSFSRAARRWFEEPPQR